MFSLEHGLPQGVRTTARLWLLSASHLLGCPHPHRKYSTSPPSGTPHESVFKGSLFNQVTYKMYMALIWKALNQYVFNGSGLSDSQPQSQGIAYRVVMKFSTKAAGDLKKHFGSQCTITHFGVMTTKLWHFGFFPNFFLSAFQSGHSVQRPPMNSRNMVAVSAHSLESYQNQWHAHHSHFFSSLYQRFSAQRPLMNSGNMTASVQSLTLELSLNPRYKVFIFSYLSQFSFSNFVLTAFWSCHSVQRPPMDSRNIVIVSAQSLSSYQNHDIFIPLLLIISMIFSTKTTHELEEHGYGQCTITHIGVRLEPEVH